MRPRCARILAARGRLITFASGLGICSGHMHTKARYLGRRKLLSYGRSGLVLGLLCLFENGNSKKFSQYFLSKLSFDKLSWLIVICLRIFFLIFANSGFFEFKCRFSWNKQPILHLVRVSRESGIWG